MKILIIDNSLKIIERLEEIISEVKGITTILKAVSYKESIRLFNEYKPDVVLIDIFLSGNESFELLKEIKKSDCKTSVIVLSILVDPDLPEQCKLQGADYFFDKYTEYEKIPEILNLIHTNTQCEVQLPYTHN